MADPNAIVAKMPRITTRPPAGTDDDKAKALRRAQDLIAVAKPLKKVKPMPKAAMSREPTLAIKPRRKAAPAKLVGQTKALVQAKGKKLGLKGRALNSAAPKRPRPTKGMK